MCLYSITTEYNGPLEAAHAHIDDDRYDMVQKRSCGPAPIGVLDVQLKINLVSLLFRDTQMKKLVMPLQQVLR